MPVTKNKTVDINSLIDDTPSSKEVDINSLIESSTPEKKNQVGKNLSVSQKGQLQHSVPITSQSQKSGYDISQNTPEFHVEAPPENPNKIENNFNLNPNEIAKGQIASGENKLSSPQEIKNIGYQKAAQEKLDKENEAANKKFRQTAIDNTVQKSLKLKGINAQKGSLLYNIEKSTYDQQLDNGNAALGTDKRTGQPGLLQSEKWYSTLGSHMMDEIHNTKEAEDFKNMSTKQRVDYANKKQQESGEYVGKTSGQVGSVLGMLGSTAPMMGRYATGALIGGALEAVAPETGGLSNVALKPVMSFAFNAGKEANKAGMAGTMQRYYSLKQHHPEMNDEDAMNEATKGEDVDRLSGIGTAALFSETGGVLGKNVTKSFVKDMLKSGAEIGGKTAAITGAKDIGHNIEGVDVKNEKEVGKDMLEAFGENAVVGTALHGFMGAVTGAVKNIPNLIKSGLKYDVVTKMNPDEIKGALDKNVQSGEITPEDAGKAEKDLGEFWKALQTVSPHLSDEAKASTAGLIVKRDNIVKSSEGLDPTAKEAIKPQIDAIDNQLREIYRTGKPLSVEINPATGETFEKPTYDAVQKERVRNAADKISKGKLLTDAEDLQAEQQFPDELKNELEKIKKSETPKEDETQSDVYKNVNKYLSKNEKENEVPNTQAQTSTANGEVNQNIQSTEKIEGTGEETIPLQVEGKSDAEIENRMAEIETDYDKRDEFNALEKEIEKRERASVFDVPLEKVSDAVDVLMKKEKEQPNGFGAFIEKRDARETKEVAEKYSNPKEISDSELKKDFKEAVMGNPDTWYADGLKLRESLKEAANRGINSKEMIGEVEKEFERDGYSAKDAKETVVRKLKPIFENSQSETKPKDISAIPLQVEGKNVKNPTLSITGANELNKQVQDSKDIDEFTRNIITDYDLKNKNRKAAQFLVKDASVEEIEKGKQSQNTDKETIKYYEDEIKNGRRPFVIKRENGEIDGNHKLEAYKNLGFEKIPTLYESDLKKFYQETKPKDISIEGKSDTPIKDEYSNRIDNLDKGSKQSDISNLSEGDYVNVPRTEKSSGVTGFVKKVGRTNVVLDTFYQLGSTNDDGIMQEITVKKSDINEFYKPTNVEAQPKKDISIEEHPEIKNLDEKYQNDLHEASNKARGEMKLNYVPEEKLAEVDNGRKLIKSQRIISKKLGYLKELANKVNC